MCSVSSVGAHVIIRKGCDPAHAHTHIRTHAHACTHAQAHSVHMNVLHAQAHRLHMNVGEDGIELFADVAAAAQE